MRCIVYRGSGQPDRQVERAVRRTDGTRPAAWMMRTFRAGKRMRPIQLSLKYTQASRLPARRSKERMRAALT
jgi:hypothetical protein